MKKFLALFLSVALMVPCFANMTFAADTINVGTIALSFNGDGMAAGTDVDTITSGLYVSTDNEATNKANYPGMTVKVTDCYCVSPSSGSLKVGDTVKLKCIVEISGSHDGTGDASKKGKSFVITSSTRASVTSTSSSGYPRKSSISKSRIDSGAMYVTITTTAIKGQYDEPANVQWVTPTKTGNVVNKATLGQAKWTSPDNENCAGIYDIRLKKNDSTVYTYTGFNATSFNFYPWMTKEGDYVFEVRSAAVASGSKNSDWASSDSQYVAKENISDGSGQGTGGGSGSTSKVGWQQVNGIWYYIFPDGTMKKNGWEKISNKWYHFDASGAMQTGWITINNETFYLDTTNGDMKTGWVKTSDGQWYYLTPAGNSGTEGAMVKNNWVDYQNKRYYMSSSGAMCTGWTKIGNDQYYFFTEGDNKGAMATNQRIDSFWVDSNGRWVKGQ